MNVIWHTSAHRNPVNAFLLYWAILTLSPLFLGMSFVATSYVFSFPFFGKYNATSTFLLQWSAYGISCIGFTCLYVVVPNYPVKWLHGIIGGIIATLLFESAKYGFAYYLTHFHMYQLIYGAFAIVPLVFIWIYWVWLITLLGAEITHALSLDPITIHKKR